MRKWDKILGVGEVLLAASNLILTEIYNCFFIVHLLIGLM